MEREVKTVTTPAGKDLVLKTYLNARERNAIRRIYLAHLQFDAAKIAAGTAAIDHIPAAALDESETELIKQAVISYGGMTDGIAEALLESLPKEYDFVITECNEVQNGNFPAAK